MSELHEQLIDLLNAEAIFLRQQLAKVTKERDAAEMRSVAHLKMYTEASQQLAELTKERDEQCAGKIAFFNGMNDMREQRTALERQLAKVTKERDEAVRIAKILTEPSPVTEDDVKWAQEMLAAQQHQEGLP